MEKLKLHRLFSRPKGPLLFVIMDGVGLGKASPENAVHVARKSCLDRLFKAELFTPLFAHGTFVGLPSDQDMGNSEIGHNIMGAGRVFAQGAKLVNEAFDSGRVFSTDSWNKVVAHGKKGGTVHFIGLFSDANVHSNIAHIYAMLDRLRSEGVRRVRVHPLLDGRDVGEKSALQFTEPAEERFGKLRSEGFDVCFASGGGRMNVTMDRYEADWSVVEKGWNAHVHGKARQFRSVKEAVETMYAEGLTDQYLDSFVIVDSAGKPLGKMNDGDAVVFFNFRGDRAIEISRAFDDKSGFDKFDRGRVPGLFYAGMMEYDGDLHVPLNYLVNPPVIERGLSQYLAASGIRSYAISETQKFGHVTYFWNGNRSGKVDERLEEYEEIPSDRITFDKAPEMKAKEISAALSSAMSSGRFDFLRVNFANGDMVGHTGVLEAAVRAIECVDRSVAGLLEKNAALGGTSVVTADHGNADIMFTEKKGVRTPMTSHTLNPVPFTVLPAPGMPALKMRKIGSAGLANIAATLLFLLGFEAPADYEPSLLELK